MTLTEWSISDRLPSVVHSFESISTANCKTKTELIKHGLFIRINCDQDILLRQLSLVQWSYWDYFYQGIMTLDQGGEYFVASIGSGLRGTFVVKKIEDKFLFQEWGEKSEFVIPVGCFFPIPNQL